MSNSVPPSGPPPPTPVTPVASAPIRATVLPTPDTPTLTQGQTLAARVVANSNNQLVLQTEQGRITVQSPTPLPVGVSVSLQVNGAGPPLQVTLQLQPGTTGGTVTPPQNQAAAATSTATTASTAAANPVTTQITQGSVLQATVTAARENSVASATANNAQSTTTSAGAPAAPNAASPATTTLQNGAALTLRILAAAPPAGVLQPAATTGGNPLLTATVIGHTPAGNPIARVDGAELTLAGTSPLPVGSRLSLELLGLQPALRTSGNPLPTPIDPWQTLREVMAILQSGDAGMTRQAAEVLLPTVGPRLAPGMLFFLSAILTGDIRRILGDDVQRLLSRSAPALLDRLSGELTQMQRLAGESAGPDWRSFFIPINTGNGLEQVRFHLYKGDDETADGEDRTGTRFVIEVNMSRLGAFQFDGFARRDQVDLVVKTHNELPQAMRDDIRGVYTNTLSAMGFAGNVAFRVTPSFDTSPVESTLDQRRDLSV
jgi:hypothetical protein